MTAGMPTGRKLLERQKKLGLVPEDAKMVDWPEVLPKWDSFSEEGKRYLSRQMEVNAAFLEHVDYHIGRVIDHIEEMGELDNTLVDLSDRRQRLYRGRNPHRDIFRAVDAERVPAADHGTAAGKTRSVRRNGCLGRAAHGQPLFRGWAYASSTPFQWTKQIASHFGGTMSPRPSDTPKR
jgi:arylsulfatase A-like enzyme